MSIDVDFVDIKILYALIRDSRTKIKDIANDCNLTSTAITKRINRLKKLGVITGAVLTFNVPENGFIGSIEVEHVKDEQAEQIAELLKSVSKILVTSYTAGKSNFNLFVVTQNEININNLKTVLKRHSNSGEINVSIWKKTHLLYDNLVIEPT